KLFGNAAGLIAKEATTTADDEDDILEMECQFEARSTTPPEVPCALETGPGGPDPAPALKESTQVTKMPLETPGQDKGKQKEHTPPCETTPPRALSPLSTMFSPIANDDRDSPGPSTRKRKHAPPAAVSNLINDGGPLSEVEAVEEVIKKKHARTGTGKVSTNKGGRKRK
ncbi:hypothetical protein OG21DRAFT_1528363, partial [Imleria badia]